MKKLLALTLALLMLLSLFSACSNSNKDAETVALVEEILTQQELDTIDTVSTEMETLRGSSTYQNSDVEQQASLILERLNAFDRPQ